MATASVLGLLFLTPATVSGQKAAATKSDTYRQLDLFADVFERIRSGYVEEVSDEQLIEAAVNGMLTSLDPHSSYMSKKNFQQFQVDTRGEYGGGGKEMMSAPSLDPATASLFDRLYAGNDAISVAYREGRAAQTQLASDLSRVITGQSLDVNGGHIFH